MQSGGSIAGTVIGALIGLAIVIFMVVAMWRVFSKAGQPGWAILVPIYSTIVLLRVAGKPWWWLFLLFIPLVDVVVAILIYAGVATNYGRGAGFTVGLIFLPFIFIPILGCGRAVYQAPVTRWPDNGLGLVRPSGGPRAPARRPARYGQAPRPRRYRTLFVN